MGPLGASTMGPLYEPILQTFKKTKGPLRRADPIRAMGTPLGGELSHHSESRLLEVQVVTMTSPTESVLGHGQDSTAVELRLGILLYSKGKHRIYHMLEYVPTRELSVLTYLTDYDSTRIMLLTPVCNHG